MSSALRLAVLLLVAGLIAFLARALFISKQESSQPADPEIQVQVASSHLPAGLLLRDEDLHWQAMPQSQVPKGAITERTEQNLIQGALLRHAVSADAVIKTSDIISANAPSFLAATLKPGMRAVSMQVDDVSGNAGLIQPGDYVDMILTQRLAYPDRQTASGSRHQIVSETVVERARVIAVGSSFQRSADKSDPIRARTVTLEVQPKAAEAITVATQLGTISLALRSFATTERDSGTAAAAGDGALVVAWQNRDQDSTQGPVWGSDVSQVLRHQADNAPAQEGATAAQTGNGNPQRQSFVIFRGGDARVIHRQQPDAPFSNVTESSPDTTQSPVSPTP